MTPIGINNGNFRNGDYREWASQDLSGVPTWDQLMELKKLETAYGADWEHDADALRQLLESEEDAHPAEVAYQLEKAMDEESTDDWCYDNGLFDDRPYRPATPVTEADELPF